MTLEAAEQARQVDGDNLIFELPPLPYDTDALAPVLSSETLEIHHGRHHARYVTMLNRLLGEQNFSAHSLEELVRIAHASGAGGLFNNAAQAWNHAFFWESMQPQRSHPGNLLSAAIVPAFGGLGALRERFISEGSTHFGSGWVWLVSRRGELDLLSTHDAGTPILDEVTVPLLACDVWEHAYYVDYRQERPRWLAAWWDELANWHFAEVQFSASLGHGDGWQYPAPVAASKK